MKKFTLALAGAAAALATACQDTTLEPTRAIRPDTAVLAARGDAASVDAQYVVVFRKDVTDAPGKAKAKVDKLKGKLKHVYQSALKGFAAELPPDAVALLEADPDVAYVEADQVMHATSTQPNATWGLDRIDQRTLPLNGTYTYTPTGAGVTVYIIDTGIRFDHVEFGGRAVSGFDAVDGGAADDCNGHGTHVAGTVGGSTYGVAKGVSLVGVRVLDCSGSGSTSGVIAGIDWVTANHASASVANMSLGGGASAALDDAVRRAITSGIVFAIAAGNDNADACTASPARVSEALTVAATTSTDARASYSNYGTCVDLFAPGSSIKSAWYTASTATNTISGTSMATPHVAGAAALFLQTNPGATPSAVANGVITTATTGSVTSAGTGSPNRLLYSPLTGSGGGGGGTPTAPCTSCQSYSGSLAGAGSSAIQPNGTYYYSAVSGTHRGWLRGPTGTDFDLYLQKWNGVFWTNVGFGETSSSEESINYAGTAGYYRWVVRSYSGAGTYTFWLQKP